jgi:SAM-dependent methyltransferase
MHTTALRSGEAFLKHYLAEIPSGRILDVGGLDVNGTLRNIAPRGCEFVSVDLVSGHGVDIVLEDPYVLPFEDNSFDAVVTTSCFEHDTFFWLTFSEMCRVAKQGGFVYVNAPSSGRYHRHPLDCWRFYPDAGFALVEWAARAGHSVSLCETFITRDNADVWNDFVGIFQKGIGDHTPVAPIYPLVDSENIHVGSNRGVIRPRGDPQFLRELRALRRKLGRDPNRSALTDPDIAALALETPITGS